MNQLSTNWQFLHPTLGRFWMSHHLQPNRDLPNRPAGSLWNDRPESSVRCRSTQRAAAMFSVNGFGREIARYAHRGVYYREVDSKRIGQAAAITMIELVWLRNSHGRTWAGQSVRPSANSNAGPSALEHSIYFLNFGNNVWSERTLLKMFRITLNKTDRNSPWVTWVSRKLYNPLCPSTSQQLLFWGLLCLHTVSEVGLLALGTRDTMRHPLANFDLLPIGNLFLLSS